MQEKTRFDIYATPGADNIAYIAGPISINYVVDTIEDLTAAETLQILKEDGIKTPCVFVINVDASIGGNTELKNRGAYYIRKHNHIGSDLKDWQEILIGPMLENTDTLSALGQLDLKEDGVIYIHHQDKKLIADIKEIKDIPEFPEYIKDQYIKIDMFPVVDDEEYHLDAPLEELGEIGDITNPLHNHTASGTCQELYESLYKLGPNVITVTKTISGIAFDIEAGKTAKQTVYLKDRAININTLPLDDQYVNITFDDVITNIVSYTNNDFALLSVNEEFISPLTYEIDYSSNTKKFTFKILSSELRGLSLNSDILFSAIFIKNPIGSNDIIPRSEIYAAMEDPKSGVSFNHLTEMIQKLYVMNRLIEIPEFKHVYLTNDDKGNLAWGNEFIANTNYGLYNKLFQYGDPECIVADGMVNINLGSLPEVSVSDSFLLFFNESYIHDAKIIANEGNYILSIKENPHYWIPEEEKFNIRIIFITSAPIDTINRLASAYISKRDATNILTRGHLSLDDYARSVDLMRYALLGHSHDAYSVKGHNHDFRYADFNHRHADMLTVENLKAQLEALGYSQELVYDYQSVAEAYLRDPKDQTKWKSEISLDDTKLYPVEGVIYYRPGISETGYIAVDDYRKNPENFLFLNSVTSDFQLTSIKKNDTGNIQYFYQLLKDSNEIQLFSLTSGIYYAYWEVARNENDPEQYLGKYVFIDATETEPAHFYQLSEADKDNTEYMSAPWYQPRFQEGDQVFTIDENLYILVKVHKDIKDPELPSTVDNDPALTKQVANAISAMGFNVDENGEISTLKASKVTIDGAQSLQKFVNDLYEKEADAAVTVNDGFNALLQKLTDPIYSKNIRLYAHNDEAIAHSQVNIGGISVNDPIPNNLADFLSALITNKDEALRLIPDHIVVEFFYKETDQFGNVLYRKIDTLEAWNTAPIYCSVYLADKFGTIIQTVSYNVEITCNDEHSPTLSAGSMYNLTDLLHLVSTDNYNLIFKVTNRSLEYTYNEFTAEYTLKTHFPKLLFLSTSDQSLISDTVVKIAEFEKSDSDLTNIKHNFMNQYLLLGIPSDDAFNVIDEFGTAVTPYFKDGLLLSRYRVAADELQTLGQGTIDKSDKITKEYNFYALPTFDSTSILTDINYAVTITEEK